MRYNIVTEHADGAIAKKPTERMKRLYHQLVDRWGEPADLITFDGAQAAQPSVLDGVHVAIWRPDEECDVATFFSIGMSEAPMPNADYRVELHLGRRGALSADQIAALAHFVANLTEYPFMYRLKLDWWERIANPGCIPGFPECTQLLLAPDLGTDETDRLDHFAPPDDDVKILRVIPITLRENQILKEHGRAEFLDYWTESGIDIWSPRTDDEGV
jgi:hypothetical protein